MDRIGPPSPTLPLPIALGVSALSFAILIWAILRARSRAGGFVIAAAWLRFVLSAFPVISSRPVVAGMSANALGSAVTFLAGCLLISPKSLMLRFLVPFYALMALAIVSAALNGSPSGLVLVLVKYGYLIVITLGVYEALRKQPDGRFMSLLMWTFFTPLVLQLASIALGVAKATEADGSASYIGGYHHEAAFSVMLAGGVVAAALAPSLNKYLRTGLIVLCVAGIYLANYRTTILAMAPLLLVFFGFSSVQNFVKRDRPLILSAALVFSCLLLGIANLFLASRFSDIGVATSGEINLFKPPELYTVEESRILSGRPRIWMGYIFAWMDGNLVQQFFGFGPESWQDRFLLYAHNTLVNYLYEYGWFGVAAILWLWFSNLAAALRVRHPSKGRLVAAHLSFLILNMGTMPMWMIEGNLMYGVICGYTLYCLSAPQEAVRRAPARRGRRGGYQAPAPQPAGAEAAQREG